jgi:enolase
MKYTISRIVGREVLDSRGNPTVEVEVYTEGGVMGKAMVPSGASTGIHEALELRDGGSRFYGKGVLKALESIKTAITPELKGLDVREQQQIDEMMINLDGTENKSRLGGNSILGVSLACAKAAALSDNLKLYEYIAGDSEPLLPVPFFNIINGGQHAGNDLDFQEFMIAPIGADSFKEAYRMGSEVYQTLKKKLAATYGRNSINVGDEGGFTPPIRSPSEAMQIILDSVEELGYGGMISLAMDVAASSFYKGDGLYSVEDSIISTGELIDIYRDLVESYPIVSIEDPLEEEDYTGFKEVTEALPIQILGDDLFVTNVKRLQKGIDMGACNALLWKVNQIGSLTEALNAADLAKRNGYNVMVSHRSGETEDPLVADLAVGIACGQIKSGAPARGERTAKYNQLLRIEEWLGVKARYPESLF